MRRLVRHAVIGLGVAAAGAGVVVGSWSGPAATVAEPAPDTTAPTASPTPSPAVDLPYGRDLGSQDTSRSDERSPLAATGPSAESRADLLAQQEKQIAARSAAIKKARALAAKKAEAARKARIKKLGYEPGTTDPKSIAKQIMANVYGWGDDQFQCYDNIIMRESMWDPTAENPSSGAYGIPQSLPGSKMAEFGDDWRTNPATQIRWGLSYVKDVYSTPCGAWGFKSSHGYY